LKSSLTGDVEAFGDSHGEVIKLIKFKDQCISSIFTCMHRSLDGVRDVYLSLLINKAVTRLSVCSGVFYACHLLLKWQDR